MYESAFGFRVRPFAAPPTVALYYPAANIEKARASLVRCVEHDAGPGLIVGPAGVGKSLLCQLLAEQFRGRMRVVMLASARLCTRRALLQNILFELGLPYRDLEEGELRLSLIEYLANDERAAQGMLLIVDEAHSLPTRLLEEIRMITNLVRDGRPRVRLILAGSARLEERFASPKLESFNQRVVVRCYLETLGREETKSYVQSQIAAAGRASGDVFSSDALDAVFDATGGIPRLINQVCDHALVLAAVGGQRLIRAAGIEEAWSDLQQLPAPWHMEAKSSKNVVEFGRLDAAAPGPAKAATDFAAAAPGQPDPVEQLKEIEHSLAAAAGESELAWTSTFSTGAEADDEEQFQPAGVIGPEVELVFHGPHAPFDETFVEEEIVIDRYAALETARLAKLRQAPWSRDRQIPERLAEAERRHEANVAAAGSSHAAGELMVDPASDPVLPEYPAAVAKIQESELHPVVPFVAAQPEPDIAAADSNTGAGLDDRDLIVVEDDSDPTPSGPTRPTGRVRRQEYRQLFARLRRS
jgi:type II secretory pathway predicted ATPase ExeA